MLPAATPGAESSPAWRIGDAERQAATDGLRVHWAAGRLGIEEFEERVYLVSEAVTQADLQAIFKDLPPMRTGPAGPPLRSPLLIGRALAVAGWLALAVLVLISVIALMTGGHGGC